MQEQSQLMPLAELLEHPWLNSRQCLALQGGTDRLSHGVALTDVLGGLHIALHLRFGLAKLCDGDCHVSQWGADVHVCYKRHKSKRKHGTQAAKR
jgi:hypothetical protein